MVEAVKFTNHLHSGETVIWSSRPGQGVHLTRRDLYLIPFSLAWGGFVIFWVTQVASSKDIPIVFAVVGIPFLIMAILIVFGRFLLDASLRRNMAYALTEQRILILRTGLWPYLKAARLDLLPGATLIEKANGRGTIRFGEQAQMWGGPNAAFGIWVACLDPTLQFLEIDNARHVFDLVQLKMKARIRTP